MKKLLLSFLLLFTLNILGQNTQLTLIQATDNTRFFECSVKFKVNKFNYISGAGIELGQFGARNLYLIGGIQLVKRLQFQTNIGYELRESYLESAVFYNANKLVLRTDNKLLIGFGFDNQNRGLFSLGYQIN
jgi:hypothetical protein